jgi:Tol biopolymer transport system component
LAAVDSGDAVQITTGPFSNEPKTPRWSPDGERIAFSCLNEGIWIVPAAGGEAVQLTALAVSGSLQWAPSGVEIAFASGPLFDQDIWIVPVAGGEPARMTAEPG